MRQNGGIRLSVWVQIALITLVFGGVYVGLRNLPAAQCGFLHYEVVEVLDDGTEVCSATNHAEFVDLSRFQYPVRFELETIGPLAPGIETEFHARFSTPKGHLLLPHELAVTHTERIHLMVVDPSLGDYHHIHPEPLGATGTWSFMMTPEHATEYRFYAEMVPVETRRQAVAFTTLTVGEGDAVLKATKGDVWMSIVGDYRFSIEPADGRFRRARENAMDLRVERTDGRPVELEEIMGAYAHLVAFDQGLSGYAHMHPLYDGREDDPAPEIGFLFSSPKPGHHRIWAQVKIEGREVFAPFDVELR